MLPRRILAAASCAVALVGLLAPTQAAARPRPRLAAAESSDGATADPSRRSLARLHDPVVLPGRALGGLATRETRRLRLVRFDDGKPVAMPFQFDQRDRRDDVVVPGPETFDLDDNDELVFMAKDAGDRAPGDPCVQAACDGALEIRVAEPAGEKQAWAYLLEFREPPPLERADPYVTFDDDGRLARSNAYAVEYARGRNYFTGLSVGPAAGGAGSNLLRQTHMIGSPTFSLLLSKVTLNFTEQNSIVEIDGVREGPVRAVRRARLSVDMGPMFPDLPSGIAYTYHYPTAYLTPSKVSFPWLMVKTLRDFRFETVMDLAPVDGSPARYFDAANPGGVSLAGDGPVVRSSDDHDWWVYSSGAGTMLHAFEIPDLWKQWGIVRGAVVRPTDDDPGVAREAKDAGSERSGTAVAEAATPPAEEAPDGGRSVGYSLLHMTKLREAGTFDLMMASVVLPGPYRAGDEAGALAMLHAPLATEVRRVR
ncbi:hypothetical protein KGQ64_02260 [bacterium]|nr:hypothetical protein [bacterium]